MVFENFDVIRIINLPNRTDRKVLMERQLTQFGAYGQSQVEFFKALRPTVPGHFYSIGAHGCFLSHLAALEEASQNGHSVLLLEDDCDFLPALNEFVMPEGTDILYGGYCASDPDDLYNSDIIGAHFMGFSAPAAKQAARYLATFLDADFTPDPRAAADPCYNPALRPGADGAYVWFRRAHPEFKTVFAQLGVQRPSRTDIGHQKWFDRVPVLRSAVNYARRFKTSRNDDLGFR